MTASVLDDVAAWLGRFVGVMHSDDLRLLALWAVHTHAATECYTTPRLLIDSPVPESGKTTCLSHLQRLSYDPVLMSSVSSPALLVRILEEHPRTLLIDEADRSLRPDNPITPDLIAILNSGYKRGATRPVLVQGPGKKWIAQEMPTFAPVALAGNDPKLPDDTRTRTIRVTLLPSTQVEDSDWEMIEDELAALVADIAEWAESHREAVRDTRPALPEGVTGRFREKWQPLARVAAVNGGDWPDVVARMALADVEQLRMDREDGLVTERPHVALLKHLAEVWPAGAVFVPTRQLVAALVDGWPDVWGRASGYGKDLTEQRLGRMLARAYKTNSHQQPDPPRARGYRLADLAPLWERTGIPIPTRAVPTVPTDPTVPNHPNSSHGSNGSGGTEKPNRSHSSHGSNGSTGTTAKPFQEPPNITAEQPGGLRCADCGRPCAPGHIRCPECTRTLFGGAS